MTVNEVIGILESLKLIGRYPSENVAIGRAIEAIKVLQEIAEKADTDYDEYCDAEWCRNKAQAWIKSWEAK